MVVRPALMVLLLIALAGAAAPAAATPPLPLANSTYIVFNSSISVPGARAPVTCYRIPMIEQTADGTLVAFAEARLGKFSKDGKTGATGGKGIFSQAALFHLWRSM